MNNFVKKSTAVPFNIRGEKEHLIRVPFDIRSEKENIELQCDTTRIVPLAHNLVNQAIDIAPECFSNIRETNVVVLQNQSTDPGFCIDPNVINSEQNQEIQCDPARILSVMPKPVNQVIDIKQECFSDTRETNEVVLHNQSTDPGFCIDPNVINLDQNQNCGGEEQQKNQEISSSIKKSIESLNKSSAVFKNSMTKINKILEREKVNKKERKDSIDGKIIKSSISDFFVDNTGGVFKVRKDNAYEEVSTYNIEFLSLIKRVEVNEIRVFLKILAQNKSDKLVLTIGLNELENIADIVRDKNPLFYLSFVGKNTAALFRQYVYKKYEAVLSNLKTEVEYNCIGWIKDLEGNNIYVSHHLSECISENTRKLEYVGVDEVNGILDWGIHFLDIGQKIDHILPIWLYSFYGFCIPLLQEAGLQTQLVYMIRGRSGSLKTAISKILFSLFEAKDSTVNFQSTKAAVESGLSDTKDNNFLWDDIYDAKHPSTKHFLEIVRCIADNIGRSKMNMRTGKKEQFHYRLGLVVTAENPIGEQMSGRLRYIVSTVEKNSFIGEKLAVYQEDAEKSLLEGHGNKLEKYYSLFIFFLQRHFRQLKKDLKTWLVEVNGGFKERRLNSAYQCFMAVSFLVTKFHFTYRKIDNERFNQILNTNQKYIFDLIAENERESSIIEDYKLWCKIISDGLASGEVSVAKNGEEYSNGRGVFLGYYFSKSELALDPNKTFVYVKKIAESRYSNAMVISKTNIEKKLDDERIIIGYDEKNGDTIRRRRLKRVVIGGLNTRFLIVDLEQFKKTITSLTDEI